MDGLILFYKPKGWTNRDILSFFQIKLGNLNFGHGGKLDPAAEGLIIIGFGKINSRLMEFLQSKSRYEINLDLNKEIDTSELQSVINFKFLKNRPKIESRTNYFLKNKKEEFIYNYEIFDHKHTYLALKIEVPAKFNIIAFINELARNLKIKAIVHKIKRVGINNLSANQALEPNDFSGPIEISATLRGKVQGVGMRYLSYNAAKGLNLTGYAKNSGKGNIEILLQGNLISLLKFQKEILAGTNSSKITGYEFIFRKLLKKRGEFVIEFD